MIGPRATEWVTPHKVPYVTLVDDGSSTSETVLYFGIAGGLFQQAPSLLCSRQTVTLTRLHPHQEEVAGQPRLETCATGLHQNKNTDPDTSPGHSNLSVFVFFCAAFVAKYKRK